MIKGMDERMLLACLALADWKQVMIECVLQDHSLAHSQVLRVLSPGEWNPLMEMKKLTWGC